MFFLVFIFLLNPLLSEKRVDRQFSWVSGQCQKDNVQGFNPLFFGECGNLSYQRFSDIKYKNQNFISSLWIASRFKNLKIKGGSMDFLNMDRGLIVQSLFENVKADFMAGTGVRFQSVSWRKSSLKNLVVRGSRMRKGPASLGVDLRKADFWGSSLQETSFEGSDLRGANLQQTHLLFTGFKGTRFDSETKLPFSEKEALHRGMVKVD